MQYRHVLLGTFHFGEKKCRTNKNRPTNTVVDLLIYVVGRQGLEPWTLGLKVPCSAY